jgi:hypothetical protein
VIPSPWIGLVLALGSFRLTRLASYDDFPPIARFRAWLVGAQGEATGSQAAHMGLSNDTVVIVWKYKRPLLAALLGCVYCIGFWISLAVYLLWLFVPTQLLYGIAPFALAAATGIIARRLDP